MTTDNLGYFRVVIEMALEKPMEIVEADEGDSPGRANGYYQAFSVTAESYSEAVAFMEEMLAELVTEEPEIAGWLVQVEADTWSEPSVDPDDEFLQDPRQAGVHFISNRGFFLAQDDEPQT